MVKLQSLSAVGGQGRAARGSWLGPVLPVLAPPSLVAWPRLAPHWPGPPRSELAPECPAPAWAQLGPRQVGLAGACQGNCTKSKKERDDEYSWVFVNTFLGI